MSYRDTCPQRTIVTVHHTVKTWLPVTLDCGHVEEINWTAREGQKIGCIECAHIHSVRVMTAQQGATPDAPGA